MIVKIFTTLIAIIIGIILVVMFVLDLALIVNFISLTFGITALIWVVKARRSLSKGSSLKALTTNFLFTIIFVLCFSVWGIIIKAFSIEETYGIFATLPYYLFITFAYITFIGASYKIRIIGKEFGFSSQVKEIKKIIKKKK